MAKGRDEDGCATVVGGLFIGVVALVAMIPKELWIALGIAIGVALLCWGIVASVAAFEKSRTAAEERARVARATELATELREREERARKDKEQRIAALGEKNAALVESALSAVKQVVGSEAARAGWLGDIDFTPDIRGIADNFQKAHALRKVANELSALDKPSADDRKILTEAKATAADLERGAIERVALIGRCATEARLVDESLNNERKDARTAEQRAELHATLSAMLYGIGAAPDATPTNSAADAVMARVQAYREIKNQIQQARGGAAG